ncbi:unnamed protein product [Dibothriocephalus latus]|uniref:EF-hand domain-containing protein n=1 Tax=Dibothriocephalus latus TaxID=60516 RepID=A0A3P7LH04_DIBLA|nr:unnamed protein product [Dibothriocephalus latus]
MENMSAYELYMSLDKDAIDSVSADELYPYLLKYYPDLPKCDFLKRFEVSDSDHDGELDLQEVGDLMRDLSLDQLLKDLDKNENDLVNADELYPHLLKSLPQLGEDDFRTICADKQEVDAFFQQLDLDGTNKISADNLFQFLKLEGLTREDFEQFIAEYDHQKDGQLDKSELRGLLLSLGF